MIPPVFLGGACGRSTWRTDTAIPLLEAAGIPYFNPQLPDGDWTPEYQYVEMAVKEAADVWLFVFTGDTRGIASIGEVAYRIAECGKIAISMEDVPVGTVIDGHALSQRECDDINRGRIYLRAMAEKHGIPVFSDVAAATRHAIVLARQAEREMSVEKLKRIVASVNVPGFEFDCDRLAGCYTLQIRRKTPHSDTGEPEEMLGRRWIIEPDADVAQVVRTLLKACLTWEEHELREHFTYQGEKIFHPHFQLPFQHGSASED